MRPGLRAPVVTDVSHPAGLPLDRVCPGLRGAARLVARHHEAHLRSVDSDSDLSESRRCRPGRGRQEVRAF